MKQTIILIAILIGIYGGLNNPRKYEVQSVKAIPAVIPSPTPTPSKKEVMKEIVELWGDEKPDRVLKVLECFYSESGFRYNAFHVNNRGSTDHGPAQINSVHTKRFGDSFKTDWKENLKVALAIYKRQGLNPWYGKLCD